MPPEERASPEAAALSAALRDRYAIERQLGRGGMATVYLAADLRHGRSVALKVLRPDLAATLGPDRFRREIQTAARLQHPHICTVYDSGESEGHLWFTMPFVRGESLRQRLERDGRLPLDEAVRITTEAGRALDYAHREGSSTATSSRRTSCSPAKATLSSPTSASPARSRPWRRTRAST